MKSTPRIYLGTMTFAWSQTSSRVDEIVGQSMVQKFVDSVSAPHRIDTARIYAGGKTEPCVAVCLSQTIGGTFLIGTKAHPSQKDGLSTKGIEGQFYASMEALGKSLLIDEYYLHQPDPEHSLLESLQCLHSFYQKGYIKTIGMSNYHAAEMERAFALCREHNLTPPTVYQGLYNPLNRLVERDLLSVLRRNNCSFVAYNPLAAGLLAGKYNTKYLENVPKGRFKDNPNYLPRFYTDENFKGVELIRTSCEEAGISMIEATYRWLLCHSALQGEDGVLVGASSVAQLEENLAACHVSSQENNGTIDGLPINVLQAFENAWTLTDTAGVFPYWRSYSLDMPNRENLEQGASYNAMKAAKKQIQ